MTRTNSGRAAPVALALAVATTLGILSPVPARAGIEPTPFVPQNYVFQGNSPLGDDPRVIFGFNPQPEPPAMQYIDQTVDLSTPGAVTITNAKLTDQGDAAEFGSSSMFEVYLGVSLLPAMHLQLDDPTQVPAPAGGPAGVQTLVFGVSDADSGASMFNVFLDFLTSSGGLLDPATIVAFNPQPEPPAGAAGAAFSFGFTSYSDVSVTLSMEDAQGNMLAFTQTPEPGTLGILCLGLLALFYGRRRHALGTS